ncbi:CXXC-type zinc finger protein 1-like isoform X2 [Gordionus sp. m RMFG-2023]|uniref:CXXC-type zinc finger protein 1-like isoform X2 n=1 Tax=Gordionus sp. m RMFG-2023 TaxID=3053472 RepID=UPI0031FC7E09
MKKRHHKDKENQEEIYCICRSSDSSRFMICCDKCNEWYHGDCINITQSEANEIEQFYCRACLESHPTLTIIYSKKKIEKKKDNEKEKNIIEKYRNPKTLHKCGQCRACLCSTDCGKCDVCKDMLKNGGPNKLRRCRERRCTNIKRTSKEDLHSIKRKYKTFDLQKFSHNNLLKSISNSSTNFQTISLRDNKINVTSTCSEVLEEEIIIDPVLENASIIHNNNNNQTANLNNSSLRASNLIESENDKNDSHAFKTVSSETFYERDEHNSNNLPIRSPSADIKNSSRYSNSSSPLSDRKVIVKSQSSPEDDTSQDPDFEREIPTKSLKQEVKKKTKSNLFSSHHHGNNNSHESHSYSENPLVNQNNSNQNINNKQQKKFTKRKNFKENRTTANINNRSMIADDSKETLDLKNDQILPPNNYPSMQCHGPKCTKSNRPGSKYCSDDCGLNLATKRIFEFLPMRIQQWQNNPSITDIKNKAQWEKVRAKQIQSQKKLEQLNEQKDKLEAIICSSKALTIDSEQNNQDSELEELDASIFCVTCGHPINPKTAPRHMEKCFSKIESQTSYGSIYQTNVGMDLFCDVYNSESQTYCKRLKVLCPEHTKEPKVDEYEVCGCPIMKDVFEETGQFCRASKKKCMKHFNWEKLRRAEIDMEKVRQLLILDDLFEEERQIRIQLSSRAGVLGLILHQTISHNPGLPFPSQQQQKKLQPQSSDSMMLESETSNSCYNENSKISPNKVSPNPKKAYSFNDEFKKSLMQRDKQTSVTG